jgi:phenylpropionate dioxygenase-like ring-hydroxylating dioxygenase large terminal subunit
MGIMSQEQVAQESLAMLVRDDRVHRNVYVDPTIFEMEMDRLFSRAWLLLGHTSQVRNAGDYFTTRMGREPILVTRHGDGTVHAFINRCTHRGSLLCHQAKGSAKSFSCPYHGWTFDSDGSLQWVPTRGGYEPGADVKIRELALRPVARVDQYRGFIFASLAATGPSLLEFLGHMSSSFDDLVDRAPDGELEIAGGVFKHAYNGNWKLVLENHLDGVHPNYVHASSVNVARGAPDPGSPERESDIAIRQMRQNGAPENVWESIGIWTTDHGHGYMGDYHNDSRLVVGLDNPVFKEYRARLVARHGEARTREILGVTRWNSIVYPNVSFMSQFRQLRIVHPLAVDRTVVYTYSFKLKGAPEQMFRDTIAFANVVNGTASFVLTDDLEVYERIQRGLSAAGTDWVNLSRGFGNDVADVHDTRRGGTGTSEIFIRNQFAAWLSYMSAA